MKPRSILPLLLATGLLTPLLWAQDAPAKILAIEQKVLLGKYQKAIQALITSAKELQSGNTAATPDMLNKRLQWLAAVDGQIKVESKTAAINGKDMTETAGTLNDLAWSMITSPIPKERQPAIALKLADIAIELGGDDWDLKPNALDTRARALFLLDKRAEAIATQERSVTAATNEEEKSGFEATLASYRKGELLEISIPDPKQPPTFPPEAVLAEKDLRSRLDQIVNLQKQLGIDDGENKAKTARLKDELAKQMAELEKLTQLKDPTARSYGSSGAVYLLNKLRTIVIPTVDFEDITLEEAAEFLRKRSVELDTTELDPAKKGLNIVVRYSPVKPVAGAAAGQGETKPEPVRIKSLHLRNVPLSEALRYVCETTRYRYKIDDYAVTLIDPTAPEDLLNRTFRVPPDFGSSLVPIQDLLKMCGVNFPEGASATLISPDMLIIRNTPSEIDKIETLVMAVETTQARKAASNAPVPVPVVPAPPVPGGR